MTEASEIGEQLRAARERHGLGLAQAAERIHVGVDVIESLETGRFQMLGAPVFVRGHLRNYAEMLGEPHEELQSRYMALHEAAMTPDLTNVPHLPAHATRAPRARWPLVILAVVLAIAVAVWWAMGVKST
jgi:cytoskeleton protein RodZ